ncbi:MAG: DUF4861 domain-containing protein [Prevotellaceae bacterium]|jgi:hypothetical protein|nr:DUF4861 domain-containing protein [Prevotellaceae bacterium]
MKKIFLPLLALAFAASCSNPALTVTATNSLAFDRNNETVEIDWITVQGKLGNVPPDNVCVTDAQGNTLLSQVVYEGMEDPQKFIFQANVAQRGKSVYTIKKGKPLIQPSKAYGRLVPERKDDYAWENNRVAFRMYGPALEATGEISNGIDLWAKRTEDLVVDKWYKDDLGGVRPYHEDHGEGLDFYKVGRTLGAGAMAPYVNNKLVLGNNFVLAQTLDNGPIRTTFELKYAPFKVENQVVLEVRRISLDAYAHLNKVREVYVGVGAQMTVAAGIVIRNDKDGYESDAANGWVAYSDTPDEKSGRLYVATIIPNQPTQIKVAESHLLSIAAYKGVEPLTYYCGGGWSKGGFPTENDWYKYVAVESEKLHNPLEIFFR